MDTALGPVNRLRATRLRRVRVGGSPPGPVVWSSGPADTVAAFGARALPPRGDVDWSALLPVGGDPRDARLESDSCVRLAPAITRHRVDAVEEVRELCRR